MFLDEPGVKLCQDGGIQKRASQRLSRHVWVTSCWICSLCYTVYRKQLADSRWEWNLLTRLNDWPSAVWASVKQTKFLFFWVNCQTFTSMWSRKLELRMFYHGMKGWLQLHISVSSLKKSNYKSGNFLVSLATETVPLSEVITVS